MNHDQTTGDYRLNAFERMYQVFNKIKSSPSYEYLLLAAKMPKIQTNSTFPKILNSRVRSIINHFRYIKYSGATAFFNKNLDVLDALMFFFTHNVVSYSDFMALINFLAQIRSSYHQLHGYNTWLIERKLNKQDSKCWKNQLLVTMTRINQVLYDKRYIYPNDPLYNSNVFWKTVSTARNLLPPNLFQIFVGPIIISHNSTRQFLRMNSPTSPNGPILVDTSSQLEWLKNSESFNRSRWWSRPHNYQSGTVKIENDQLKGYFLCLSGSTLYGGKPVPESKKFYDWKIIPLDDNFNFWALKHVESGQYIYSGSQTLDSRMAINEVKPQKTKINSVAKNWYVSYWMPSRYGNHGE